MGATYSWGSLLGGAEPEANLCWPDHSSFVLSLSLLFTTPLSPLWDRPLLVDSTGYDSQAFPLGSVFSRLGFS